MENARPALNWGTDLTLQKTKYIQVWRGDLVLRARASAPGRARRRRGAPRASGSRAAPSRRSSPAPAGRTGPVRRRAVPRARGGRSAGGARGRGLRRGFGRREGRRVTPPEGESALETARAPPRARLVGTRAGGWGLCVPRPASPPPSRVPGRAALSRPRPRQGPSPGKPLAPSSSPPTSKPRRPPRHSACAHSACSPVFPSAHSASSDRTGGLFRNPETPHQKTKINEDKQPGARALAVRFSEPRDAVSGPRCGIRTEWNSVLLRSVRASARPGGTRSPRPAAG